MRPAATITMCIRVPRVDDPADTGGDPDVGVEDRAGNGIL